MKIWSRVVLISGPMVLFSALALVAQNFSIRSSDHFDVADVPTARPDSFSICKDASLSFTEIQLLKNDSDPQGDPLKVEYLINPASGTLVSNGNGSYSFTPDPGFTGTVQIKYVIKKDDGFTSFQENKHFYEFVVAPKISWEDARNEADGKNYQGMQGYLVTITSAAENAFVSAKLKGQGWIGASDQETEGVWKWVTGPEAGLHFSDQYVTGFCQATTAWGINGNYANWYQGEPNNCGDGGEDYAHFYPGGVWNDYPNYVENIVEGQNRIAGYIVEYGGLENLVDLTTTGTIVITVATPGLHFNQKDVSCFGGQDGSLDLQVRGGIPPYTYTWSTGASTSFISGLGPGVYSVVLTDSVGCSSSAEAFVAEPEPLQSILPQDTMICFGDRISSIPNQVKGGTEPYYFLWSNGQTGQDLIGAGAGSYTVTVRDANDCLVSSEITIRQSESPVEVEAKTSDYQGYSVSCFGSTNGSIELKISGGNPGPDGYSIQWEDGSASDSRDQLGSGTYRVFVADVLGCSQTVEVELNEPASLDLSLTPSIFPGGYNLPCKGSLEGSIQSEISGGALPYELNWTDGFSGKDLFSLRAGSYSAVVVDANGCRTAAEVNLIEPDSIEFQLSKNPPSCFDCEDGSIEIRELNGGVAPYTVQWNGEELGALIGGLSVGTYSVIVTDANNCIASRQIELDLGFQIPNAFTPNQDGINDHWEIKSLEDYPDSRVVIYNTKGKLVFESEPGYPKPWDGTLDGVILPTGTYYYLITLSPNQKALSGNLTLIR